MRSFVVNSHPEVLSNIFYDLMWLTPYLRRIYIYVEYPFKFNLKAKTHNIDIQRQHRGCDWTGIIF